MGLFNRLFESPEAKADRLEKDRLEKERKAQIRKVMEAEQAARREQERIEEEAKAEIKKMIEAGHRDIVVINNRLKLGKLVYVSPKFPTTSCASCGTTGDFPLVKVTWTSLPGAGVIRTHSILLPQCSDCYDLKIKKPDGLGENKYRNLHSNYIEAIRIANPDISNITEYASSP